ncbi:hypothetical protein CLIM01_09088 [Colletotrichum limetticola]|uniref:Secreted protein n=1 Tax=Colletotrichum limetticola TaxID=1209924 RepID=A0ABQ9PPT9_9PEZI|nr:hypothetical protein CLIM01_09088 [Colletotrichum limetticola]
MGERTGSRVFQWVWSYVTICIVNGSYTGCLCCFAMAQNSRCLDDYSHSREPQQLTTSITLQSRPTFLGQITPNTTCSRITCLAIDIYRSSHASSPLPN